MCTPTKYYLCRQIKKYEMGMAWAYMVQKRGAEGFWWGDLRERDHLEDLNIDGRKILK